MSTFATKDDTKTMEGFQPLEKSKADWEKLPRSDRSRAPSTEKSERALPNIAGKSLIALVVIPPGGKSAHSRARPFIELDVEQ